MSTEQQLQLRPLAENGGLAAWEAKRPGIRATMRQILGPRPAAMPPPERRILDRVRFPGYERLTLEFTVEPGEEIAAYVYLPEGTGKVPGLVAYHQTADDGKEEVAGQTAASRQFAYAPTLAANGYAVISFDDVVAGDRVPGADKPYYTDRHYARHPGWSVLDKAVWDGKQALTVLTSFEQVDASRLGAAGHSQGGFYAWLLAADDERVKAAVANCGFTTLEGDREPEKWVRDNWYVAIPALRPYLAGRNFPFDFHEWAAQVAPRALMLLGTRNDVTLPNWQGFAAAAEEIEKVYACYGAANRFRAVLTDGPHAFPAEAQQAMLAFLHENLA